LPTIAYCIENWIRQKEEETEITVTEKKNPEQETEPTLQPELHSGGDGIDCLWFWL
jgi:hypothetical protein